MNEDEYLGGLDPIPTKRPVDQRDNQPYRPSPPSVDARELAAIRAEVQRLQRGREAAEGAHLQRPQALRPDAVTRTP